MSDPIPAQIEFVATSSVHLATLMATCGCKPQRLVRGPRVLSDGSLQTHWCFDSTPKGKELVCLWQHPLEVPEWENLTAHERHIVTAYASAFAANIKHFVGHAKGRPLTETEIRHAG